jgi:serine protease AprX
MTLAGTAGARSSPTHEKIDDHIDLSADSPQEVIVVFDSRTALESVDVLDRVDLRTYWEFEALPMAFGVGIGPEIELLAELPGVRYVSENYELEYHNADSRALTGAGRINAGTADGVDTAYAGENTHAVVIDSGVDPNHPGLAVQQNFRYVGAPVAQSEPLAWVDAGQLDTDGSGHGSHCIGSLSGNGASSGGDDEFTEEYGQHAGMAPETTITCYSVGAGGLLLVFIVAAYDHMIAEQESDSDTTYHLVSNSYGPASQTRDRFAPEDPQNVATWRAHEAGILPLFSAGNSGPDSSTLGQYAKAPHVLGVAATGANQTVSGFSSRGYPANGDGPTNYDRRVAYENLSRLRSEGVDSVEGPTGIYRNGIGAKGGGVTSSMSPQHYLGAPPAQPLFYASISGTSMSCPTTAGCASLVVDAYIDQFGEPPAPMTVLNTLEATAAPDPNEATNYTAESMGTGYVDAAAAVREVLEADAPDGLPGFDDVDVLESAATRDA